MHIEIKPEQRTNNLFEAPNNLPRISKHAIFASSPSDSICPMMRDEDDFLLHDDDLCVRRSNKQLRNRTEDECPNADSKRQKVATGTPTPSATSPNHLVVIHDQIEEMGKALKCAICQSSLHRPCLLPCIHAFCHDCIHTYLSSTVRNNTKQKAGTTTGSCPICKEPVTKRSIRPSEHLADIVKAFKHTAQAFGLAPIVYSPAVEMTQLQPNSEADDQQQEEQQQPSLADCHTHLSVSKAMFQGLRQHAASTAVTTPAEYAAKKATSHTAHYSIIPTPARKSNAAKKAVEAQRKIIQVDERALVAAAVQKQEQQRHLPKDPSPQNDGNQHKEEEINTYKSSSELPQQLSIATGTLAANQSEHPTIRIVGTGTDTMNNVDNDSQPKPLWTLTQESMLANALREDEAVNHSLEWMEEEEEQNKEERSFVVDRDTNRSSTNEALIKRTKDSSRDETLIQPTNNVDTASRPAPPAVYPVGTVVQVALRTWPGINKPGGVARITHIHHIENQHVEQGPMPSIQYDVSYVLGGKEKHVDALYVTLLQDEELQESSDIARQDSHGGQSRNTRSCTKKRKTSSPAEKENETPPMVKKAGQNASSSLRKSVMCSVDTVAYPSSAQESIESEMKTEQYYSPGSTKQATVNATNEDCASSPRDNIEQENATLVMTEERLCQLADEWYEDMISRHLAEVSYVQCT